MFPDYVSISYDYGKSGSPLYPVVTENQFEECFNKKVKRLLKAVNDIKIKLTKLCENFACGT